MKTNFIKTLATLALSVFAIGSFAQCPTISGIYVQQGTGTADVAAMMTPSTSVGTGWFNWTVSPAAYTTPVSGTNNSMQSLVFSATGVYTVCVYYTDSTTMCSASTCTTINVTSVASNTCNAAFSAVTSTNTCMTYFTNASTGTNLTYKWYKQGSALLSTQANPTLSLGNGSHTIILYTYSNGQFCDSTSSVVNVSCPTGTVCNAVFSTYTDASSCFTHFYNNSTGSNLTYKWYELPGMTLLSTTSSPVLSLGTGYHTVALFSYSSGQFCDSTLAVINVTCNPSSNCNAAFTNSLSGCTNYFFSTSTGTSLTYEWRNMTTFPFPVLSTQSSFTTSLPAGSNVIALYVYSGGQFCDSTTHVVNGCNTNTTSCQANSQFTVFADSVNAGNYFAYNQSTGTGAVTYLWDFGDGNTSTQQYPFHQYANPGQYVICLTVSATNGSVTCSDVSCDSSSVQRISSAFLMSKIQVMPQGPTAVKENTVLKNLSVYPNPIENELTVEVELTRDEKISYVITDALGKVVAKNELTSAKTVINTATLDRGMYFLSVTSNDQVLKTTKLMK
jgi:PKD repeat protein